jgi:hypothetical protein
MSILDNDGRLNIDGNELREIEFAMAKRVQ